MGNQNLALPKRNRGAPIPRPEWKKELTASKMTQVNELLELIEALKLMGVTGASVMYSFFERHVQPLQKRSRLSFNYSETEYPSRMCAEELAPGEALMRMRLVLLDVATTPYVPTLFTAKNQPNEVSTIVARVLFSVSYAL